MFIWHFYRQSCISLETNILKKHDTCTWLRAQEEGPEKRTRVLQSAGRHAGRIGREKQTGQIRESRKRGRLQFVLWSSLRNETADWRDGVFVRFTQRKKWRRLRAILLMNTLCKEETRSLPRSFCTTAHFQNLMKNHIRNI